MVRQEIHQMRRYANGAHARAASPVRDAEGFVQIDVANVGADVARRKKSLPILHGLEHSAELDALLAKETLSAADVHHATELLEEANSREYTEQLAREHHNRALGAMEEANLQGPAAQAIHELAQMLLGRKR